MHQHHAGNSNSYTGSIGFSLSSIFSDLQRQLYIDHCNRCGQLHMVARNGIERNNRRNSNSITNSYHNLHGNRHECGMQRYSDRDDHC